MLRERERELANGWKSRAAKSAKPDGGDTVDTTVLEGKFEEESMFVPGAGDGLPAEEQEFDEEAKAILEGNPPKLGSPELYRSSNENAYNISHAIEKKLTDASRT